MAVVVGSSSEPEVINLAPRPLSYTFNTNEAALIIYLEDLLEGASDPENQILTTKNFKLRSGNDIGITPPCDPSDFLVEPHYYNNLLLLGESEEVIFDYTISGGNGSNVNTSITFILNGVRDGRRLDTFTFANPKLQTCVNEIITRDSLTFVYEFHSLVCENIDYAQGIENLTALQWL